MKQKHIKHLLWRGGFGVSPKQVEYYSKFNKKKVVDMLFKDSQPTSRISVDTSDLDALANKLAHKDADESLKIEFNQKSLEKTWELNIAWIEQIVHSKQVLRERMTLFWANHFVCRDRHIYHTQQYNNILRQHALGNFGNFVKAISKEASMIKYLNLRENRKQRPNENFARELMELFTLGIGNYTEKDIKESARAFTGYNHNFKGEFKPRRFQHDEGEKVFFSKSGNFNGDDIIDIILEQKRCAQFICEKVYTYFVNPVINESHVEQMTAVFYKSYNIEKLMRFVFLSEWFYDDSNVGAKIKSPVDHLVGMLKTVPAEFKNKKDYIKIQRILGQILLDPPNVAGWKGHTAWIDVNTMMVRLRLPSVLFNNGMIASENETEHTLELKSRFSESLKNKIPFKTQPKWEIFHEEFKNVPKEDLKDYIICGNLNAGTEAMLDALNKYDKKEYCIQLMSLPEYQMC